MHQGVVDWVRATCLPEMVHDRRVLEVGSADWNGSMREWFEAQKPAEYVGVDIVEAPGVDEVVSATQLIQRFGPERWDLILCLEMLEHADQWQLALHQMKLSLAQGGWLILTTRAPGYPLHAPPDHWRFSKEVLKESLPDLDGVETWSDPGFAVPNERGGTYFPQPGVFLRAQRLHRGWGSIVEQLELQAEPAPTEAADQYINPITKEVVERGW